MLILNVLQGPDKGKRFELPDTEPQQIGRSSESLPLTDHTISRRHAELTPDDGRWYIHDLQSANGTYVNGKRITEPTLLRPGDQIRTGSTLLVFGRLEADAAGSHPVRVMSGDRMDTAVEASVPSNEESMVMASPDPSETARLHLRLLYELMHLVGSIFDKELLLERVMDLVFEHFQPDRGLILLRHGQTAKAEPAVVRHRQDPGDEEEQSISISRTIVHHVMQKAEGVLSSNAMTDRRFAAGESVQVHGIRSAICVPIKFRQQVYGVIYIDSKIANYTFTEDQLRLMTAVGAQTGLALENAELYQQGMQRARLAAIGETVASLSHSIRNILQAIQGGAEVVELGLRKEELPVVNNGWGILHRNLDRIYELTTNMLTFSKRRQPEFEEVDLAELLREIVSLMRDPCEKRQVSLSSEIASNIPTVYADPGGIHQAVLNLVNNALDAVEPDEGQITLTGSYEPESKQAVIAVTDNGQGIDEPTQRQIFRPFFSTKGQHGTGLGLAVTKKVAESHNGRIDIESSPGSGTTLTIRLPATQRRDPAATRG